jgi:predicted nucleotidyltransferase
LSGLLEALRAVSGWLSENHVAFAVVGGVAASLHGRPRVTKDVDLVAIADERVWRELVKRAAERQIRPRIKDALDFARTTRVLLLEHRPTRIEIDLSFGMLPFELELVKRASTKIVKGLRFPLASAEDIVVMKALALRPRDVADIEGILETLPKLDLKRVRTTVRELSAGLETDDHAAAFEAILKKVGPKKVGRPRRA